MPDAKTIADCYAILELPRTATSADLKQAYRDLSKVWHPDRFGEHDERLRLRAEERLKEINTAYGRLSQHLARSPGPARPDGAASPKPPTSHAEPRARPEAAPPPPSTPRHARPPAPRKLPQTRLGIPVVVSLIVVLAAVTITIVFDRKTPERASSSAPAHPGKAISYLGWYEAADGEQGGAYQVELWRDHSHGDELLGWVSHVVEGVDDPTGRLVVVELDATNGKFSFRSSMLGEDVSFSGIWRSHEMAGKMTSTRVEGPWRATFKAGDVAYQKDYYDSREAWEKGMQAILRCCGPNAVRGPRTWR